MCKNKTATYYRKVENVVATFALLLLLLIEGSSQQCASFSDAPVIKQRPSDLYSAQQEFSLIIFNAINKVKRNRNVLFSPYSMHRSLLIAYFLSGGQTERYLKKVLRVEEIENKLELFAPYKTNKFITELQATEYQFKFANKVFISQEMPIKECLLELFLQELEKISFRSSPDAARNSINRWVDGATVGAIKDLFPVGSIDQNTELVLVNAASLKGPLENGFDPRLTRVETFYIGISRQVVVPMMYLEGRFKHGVSVTLGAHVLEMPYAENHLSLFVLLPPFFDSSDSITPLLKRLTLENLRKLVSGVDLTYKTVQVALPKFKMETTVDITPVLESLVVGNFFESNADFSMLGGKSVAVGQGIHKATIEISEQLKNTTSKLTDDKRVVKFICNHPFAYVVYNKKTHDVALMGVLRNPSL